MVEAFLGIILATAAAFSLLVTIGISNKSIKNAGRENLSISEKEIIIKAGFSEDEISLIESEIKNFDFNKF